MRSGNIKNKKWKIKKWLLFTSYFLLLTSYFSLFSCGYHIIGSTSLPFNSITIRQIQNKTYEPRLEERLHDALSKEFIAQGIKVVAGGGDIALEATVTTFELATIAAVNEKVKEQEIIMRTDIKVIDEEKVTEFTAMESPIRITFQSTGTVSESVAEKERAIDKACSEIAKEIVSKIIIRYAK